MEIDNTRKTLELRFQDRTAFEVPYSMVSQCAVPGKNEIELQFEDDDTGPREDEMLVQMRFSVPAGGCDGWFGEIYGIALALKFKNS